MIRAFTSSDVARAEEPLLAGGEPLMARASFALAATVRRALSRRGVRMSGTTVLALVGAGNNGGDALHAAALLARRGAGVHAALLTGSAHEEGLSAARGAGVRVHRLAAGGGVDVAALIEVARGCAVWIDGITGAGSRGALREPLAGAVGALAHEAASSPDAPFVVAVDVPSGVGVDDGSVPGPVLPAGLTVAMGTAKPAHLLAPAAGVVGELEVVDLDLLPQLLADGAEPSVVRLRGSDVADLWPVPEADAHKYTRGVLHVRAGSPQFPGAASLVTAGALGAGVGMVRLDAASEVTDVVLASFPEAVPGDGRAQAHVVGPGLGDDPQVLDEAGRALRRATSALEPVVLDASGLALLTRDEWQDLPSTVVLTPHAGELATLLSARGEEVSRADVEEAPGRHARLAAEVTGATVLVKGPVSVVAAPDGPLVAQQDGTRWLSTAGAGDVLAGVLGALLAGHGELLARGAREGVDAGPPLARLAGLAALVHGAAARRAAGLPWDGGGEELGGPLRSADIAAALPATIRRLLGDRA